MRLSRSSPQNTAKVCAKLLLSNKTKTLYESMKVKKALLTLNVKIPSPEMSCHLVSQISNISEELADFFRYPEDGGSLFLLSTRVERS
jgi:hypothetical protein